MKGRVYFLQVGRFIKIGHSVTLMARFNMLKSGCPYPVTLVGSFPGTRRTEARLHKRFASLRIRREWFRATEELLDFVADHSVPLKKKRGMVGFVVNIDNDLMRQARRYGLDVEAICREAIMELEGAA